VQQRGIIGVNFSFLSNLGCCLLGDDELRPFAILKRFIEAGEPRAEISHHQIEPLLKSI
jgi:hypothetical protein